jgi:hypothetical protein
VSHRCQDEKAIAIALNIEDAINQAPLAPLVSTSQAEFGQRKKKNSLDEKYPGHLDIQYQLVRVVVINLPHTTSGTLS